MAYIDKIYVYNHKQFLEYENWCKKFDDLCIKNTGTSLLDCIYYTSEDIYEYYKDSYSPKGIPLCNNPKIIDLWLIKHCPISFIRERLLEQYGEVFFNKLNNQIELYLDR